MEDKSEDKFESWAVVEIMGHKKLAGLVTEQTIGGSALIRIDVPEIPADPQMTLDGGRASEAVPGFTKLYGVAYLEVADCFDGFKDYLRYISAKAKAQP